MFPSEIFRLISLLLPPGKLAITCQLSAMYSDTWYEDYLTKLCPDVQLWKQTSYRDRYKKFLQSGKICKYKRGKLSSWIGRGVAAADTENNNMILTFNGDLYMGDALIDNHVIAIDSCTYIKEWEWWYYDGNDWSIMYVTPKSPFISVKYYDDYAFAITKEGLYWANFYGGQEIYYLPYPQIREIIIADGVYVLDDRGDIYELDIEVGSGWGRKERVATQVAALYRGGIKLQDGQVKLFYKDYDLNKLVIKNLPQSGEITNIETYYLEFFLLRDAKIYYYLIDDLEDKHLMTTSPSLDKVKRILGNWTGIYFICEEDASPINPNAFDESLCDTITL